MTRFSDLLTLHPLCRALGRAMDITLGITLSITLGLTLRRATAVASLVALAGALPLVLGDAQAQGRVAGVRNGDYISAVVNQESVTAGEVERRMELARANFARASQRLPPEDELRKQALDSLIEERVIVTSARDSGMKVDDTELDRAVQSIAAQNRITLPVLRERLRAEGTDYGRFRANLRDQIMIERLREREVYQRIRISDEEIEQQLVEQRKAGAADSPINIAQILVTIPDGADDATVAQRRGVAMQALARVTAGEAFELVARELSEDGNREKGGEIGLRPASRLPDLFVEAVAGLKQGQWTLAPVRSGAGFHILKVLQKQDLSEPKVTQVRARHVLLRTSPQLTSEVAAQRLAEYRADIEAGKRSFEDTARQFSEDGSAAAGGDLGWAGPGVMVPEFEAAMTPLALNGISDPVVSRFGVHLIQVLERREVALDPKQLREQARSVLREQKFDQAYADWAKELRSRAYVELREPPV
jgi:peptidyl-prolyl cis-trans isomerase SurA